VTDGSCIAKNLLELVAISSGLAVALIRAIFELTKRLLLPPVEPLLIKKVRVKSFTSYFSSSSRTKFLILPLTLLSLDAKRKGETNSCYFWIFLYRPESGYLSYRPLTYEPTMFALIYFSKTSVL
jgi:hypothetical protein